MAYRESYAGKGVRGQNAKKSLTKMEPKRRPQVLPRLFRVAPELRLNVHLKVDSAGGGRREKSAFAQPINNSGSGATISEQCEISQTAEIARLQIALYPGAREISCRQLSPLPQSYCLRLSPKLLTGNQTRRMSKKRR